MQATLIGNIAAVVSAHIAESLGDAVEEDILKGVVKEVLPECGIVLKAEKEELRDNPKVGALLYRDCDIVVRSDCETILNREEKEE